MTDPNLKVIELDMTCKTKNNKTDCGVFAMRYMETYMGQTDRSYKTGFPKEGLPQDVMLDRIRSRYAHTILMSEINLKRNEIFECAKAYNKEPKETKHEDSVKACIIIANRLKNP